MTHSLLIGAIGVLLGFAGVIVVVVSTGPASASDDYPAVSPSGARPRRSSSSAVRSGDYSEPREARDRRRLLVVASAVGLATLVAGLTRWPVAAALAGIAGSGLPRLLRSLSSTSHTDRIEAVAAWTELLRDTLAAAAGLGQAIVATAELAPPPIRGEVTRLADRLVNGISIEDALRTFATEVDDASTDLVVCALLVAATARSQRLADLLGSLAASCRDEVALRLKIEASRASARSSVRSVALISVAFAALLFVFAHAYLTPFGTATGQVVLLAVGACYAAGLVIMVALVRPRPAYRLLGGESES